MKTWVYDSSSEDFIKITTRERVKRKDLESFESDNHEMLRGMKGDARLDLCLGNQVPSVSAAKDPTPRGDPLVELHTEADAVVEGVYPPKEFCMVCGNLPHEGECQLV